jgi:hypothetical protein
MYVDAPYFEPMKARHVIRKFKHRPRPRKWKS